jgi:hypothetical protein
MIGSSIGSTMTTLNPIYQASQMALTGEPSLELQALIQGIMDRFSGNSWYDRYVNTNREVNKRQMNISVSEAQGRGD